MQTVHPEIKSVTYVPNLGDKMRHVVPNSGKVVQGTFYQLGQDKLS